MARKNKNGTPYLGLFDVRSPETKAIRAYLKKKDVSAKHWLRYLIRKELRELPTKNTQL